MINITPLSNNSKTFIEKSNKKHNYYYDYSLVDYVGSLTSVKIICPKHGGFTLQPNMHVFGIGCKKCGGDRIAKSKFSNKDKFIEKSQKIYGDLYDYSLVDYKHSKVKVKILCSKHGEFEKKPCQHTNMKQGCPRCKSSKGETTIENFLKNSNINYITEKRFPNCKNKRPLPFDFYLPDYDSVIEFQGGQHYFPVKWFGGEESFENIKFRDKIKREFCYANNISYIEINNQNLNELQTIIRFYT
jgi:hypothetical protein